MQRLWRASSLVARDWVRCWDRRNREPRLGEGGMAAERSDELLLRQWDAGDQEAAAEFYRRYAPRLCRLVRVQIGRRLRRRLDAEDVVQWGFCAFFRRAVPPSRSASDERAVRRLLVRLTMHALAKVVEANRASKRNPACEAYDLDERLVWGGLTPEEQAILADEWGSLASRFSWRDRAIIALWLAGRPRGEIALRVRVSEATVRRVVGRFRRLAHRRLRLGSVCQYAHVGF